MKTPRLSIVVALLFLAFFSSVVQSKANIRTITKENYEQFSKDRSYWIIQISQQGCQQNQCKQDQQQLEKAAELLQGVCKFAKIDAKMLQGIAQIQENPTYVFVRSDNLQNSYVQFTGNSDQLSRESLAKFCLNEVQKAVKKRNKQLFSDSKTFKSSSRKSAENQKKQSSSTASKKKLDPTKLIDLTDKNFEKLVVQNQKQSWFVLFYSPSCGHCKNMQPQYEKLPAKIGTKVYIARIDATKNQQMAQKYQIKGFPTLLMFESENKQNPITYDGQRTAQDMSAWLSTKKLNKLKKQLHLLDQNSYKQKCNRNIICFIFILESKSDKPQLKFIKPLLQETIDKPIQYFYSERRPQLETYLMIEDRQTPKMVAIWQGIKSYRLFTGQNSQEGLNGFIERLMERRRWIKFEQDDYKHKLLFVRQDEKNNSEL